MFNNLIKSDLRIERGGISCIFYFRSFSLHSTNSFLISAHYLIVIANIDMNILKRSAKVLCGPTFLSNSLKVQIFSFNEKAFSFMINFRS